ncbi:unnamed protein product [Symbiodinium pilosum]|uniref:Uncharacterized protein n=1 Tax=Symbiodinium pilosum TaxID=2952 RepID=A0A812K692_SYMPI|nr:unnamed protein product [Symbiodinium pilosum]
MRLLKRVGELLDTADEKATEADLQTLTRHVGDALGSKANEASGIKLDLGIVEGLSDLKNQLQEGLGSDLKDLGEKEGRGDACVDAHRLAALKERVEELYAKEAERAEQRERLQANLLEVESSIQQMQTSTAEAASNPLRQPVNFQELLREFREREAQSLQHQAALADANAQVAATNEHLLQQLHFWKSKASMKLASLGLESVPKEVEQAIGELKGRAPPADKVKPFPTGSPAAGTPKEHADEKRAIQDLEAMLAELMRSSEDIMGRVEQQRHQERDLISQLASAQEIAAQEAKAFSDTQRKLEVVRAKAQEIAHPAAVRPLPSRVDEVVKLRAEVETLRARLESSTQERSRLEAQLGKNRAAAAADLERAVPSSAMSCWTWLDVPLMRLVTLLVKSTCLRRSFALHLLATYSWLFFLVFWLEKHP